jgi:hypothetical protein
MKSRKTRIIGAMLLLALASSGCASLIDSRSFINKEADFSFYKKVGLLPFRNLAEDRLAGEKVTEHFMTELLIAGELDVMDPGQFNAVVAQVARTNAPVSTLELGTAQLTQIASVAGVQGIFMGTIHDFRMIQLGGDQYPLISMTVKFIDAPTGTVAWQNSTNITGGPNLPIVSIGETFTLGELSQKVCRTVVKDFFMKAHTTK